MLAASRFVEGEVVAITYVCKARLPLGSEVGGHITVRERTIFVNADMSFDGS